MLMDPRSGNGIGKALVLAIASTFVSRGAARAADVTLNCSRADVFNPQWNAPIAFAFQGESHGMLEVDGIFGAFAIPAFRRSVEVPGVTTDMIEDAAKAHVKALPVNRRGILPPDRRRTLTPVG